MALLQKTLGGFLALAVLLLMQACGGCGAVAAGNKDAISAQGDVANLDAAFLGDGNILVDGQTLADGVTGDTDPLQQNLPQFCEGTGAVVNIGSQDICAGDLAAQTFRFALCACEGISLGGQLNIDAFDSTVGPYGGSNIIEDGHLGLNQGDLTLSHKLTVAGSAFVGGGGVGFFPDSRVSQNLHANGDVAMIGAGSRATIGRNAYINGDVGQRITIEGDLYVPASSTVNGSVTGDTVQQEIPALLPCPCAQNQILDIAGLTSWAATNNDNAFYALDEDAGVIEDGSGDIGLDPDMYSSGGPSVLRLPCGRYYLSAVNQAGIALDIYISARTVLFVNGDLSAQRFAIHIEEGGELDLFVAGNLNIGAAADFGSAEHPAAVRTYVAGNLSLQANAEFAGNVYAPNADIAFGAEASIFGALFVKSVSFQASGDVHFDSAIRNAAADCVEPTSPDAGVSGDGGGSNTDGGSSVDATEELGCSGVCSFECGELACIMPSGQGAGECGPCTSDLDCCAPLVCDEQNGMCVYLGG